MVNLILLGWSHFHPQWFTWIMPFWSIWIVSLKNWREIKIAGLLTGMVILIWTSIIVLFNDKFLTWGIISPLNPNIINLPVIADYLTSKSIDVKRMVNSAHSALAGVSLMLIIASVGSNRLINFIKIKDLPIKKIKLSLPIRFLISLSPIIVIFTFLFMTYLIPAPVGIILNDDLKYIIFPDEIKTSFITKFNRLNRIELYLRNPGLKSNDIFLFSLKNHSNNVSFTSTASAFNAGDPSILRFEFPSTISEKGDELDLTLSRIATSGAERLYIGVNNQTNTLLYRQFYDSKISITDAYKFSLDRFMLLISQSYWQLIGIELCLGLLLFSDILRKKYA